MSYQHLLFKKKTDNVAVLTMNRPKVLNALSTEVFNELNQVFGEIEADKSILGLIVTGNGRGFAAGADLAELVDAGIEENRVYAGLAMNTFNRLEALPLPTIAAVNGFALGGGNELAMSCDIRIAGEKAKFSQPEVSLGTIPCFGGTQRLPRFVGYGKAKELIMTGRMIKAPEALEIGLVNQVVPQDELMDKAMEVMDSMLAQSPTGVRYAKYVMDITRDMTMTEGLEVEKSISAICYGLEDKYEGLHAFVEKRKPVYKQERFS